MKSSSTLLMLLFLSISSKAQIDTTMLLKQVQKYMDFYMDREYDSLANLIHPNIVSLGGGSVYVKQDLQVDRETFDEFQMEFIDAKAEAPSQIFENNDELLCFVPQYYHLKMGESEYQLISHVLASSSTKGKSWSFVSLDRFDQPGLKDFIPNYNPEMGWPERQALIPIQPSEK